MVVLGRNSKVRERGVSAIFGAVVFLLVFLVAFSYLFLAFGMQLQYSVSNVRVNELQNDKVKESLRFSVSSDSIVVDNVWGKDTVLKYLLVYDSNNQLIKEVRLNLPVPSLASRTIVLSDYGVSGSKYLFVTALGNVFDPEASAVSSVGGGRLYGSSWVFGGQVNDPVALFANPFNDSRIYVVEYQDNGALIHIVDSRNLTVVDSIGTPPDFTREVTLKEGNKIKIRLENVVPTASQRYVYLINTEGTVLLYDALYRDYVQRWSSPQPYWVEQYVVYAPYGMVFERNHGTAVYYAFAVGDYLVMVYSADGVTDTGVYFVNGSLRRLSSVFPGSVYGVRVFINTPFESWVLYQRGQNRGPFDLFKFNMTGVYKYTIPSYANQLFGDAYITDFNALFYQVVMTNPVGGGLAYYIDYVNKSVLPQVVSSSAFTLSGTYLARYWGYTGSVSVPRAYYYASEVFTSQWTGYVKYLKVYVDSMYIYYSPGGINYKLIDMSTSTTIWSAWVWIYGNSYSWVGVGWRYWVLEIYPSWSNVQIFAGRQYKLEITPVDGYITIPRDSDADYNNGYSVIDGGSSPGDIRFGIWINGVNNLANNGLVSVSQYATAYYRISDGNIPINYTNYFLDYSFLSGNGLYTTNQELNQFAINSFVDVQSISTTQYVLSNNILPGSKFYMHAVYKYVKPTDSGAGLDISSSPMFAQTFVVPPGVFSINDIVLYARYYSGVYGVALWSVDANGVPSSQLTQVFQLSSNPPLLSVYNLNIKVTPGQKYALVFYKTVASSTYVTAYSDSNTAETLYVYSNNAWVKYYYDLMFMVGYTWDISSYVTITSYNSLYDKITVSPISLSYTTTLPYWVVNATIYYYKGYQPIYNVMNLPTPIINGLPGPKSTILINTLASSSIFNTSSGLFTILNRSLPLVTVYNAFKYSYASWGFTLHEAGNYRIYDWRGNLKAILNITSTHLIQYFFPVAVAYNNTAYYLAYVGTGWQLYKAELLTSYPPIGYGQAAYITITASGIDSQATGNIIQISTLTIPGNQLPTTIILIQGQQYPVTWYDPVTSSSTGIRYVWLSSSGLLTTKTGTITAINGSTLSATYKKQVYITTNTYPNNAGTITPQSGWYDYGQTITFTATPNTGWFFNYWIIDNNPIAYYREPNSVNIDTTTPHTIIAHFADVSAKLLPGSGYTIGPNNIVYVPRGSTVTIQIQVYSTSGITRNVNVRLGYVTTTSTTVEFLGPSNGATAFTISIRVSVASNAPNDFVANVQVLLYINDYDDQTDMWFAVYAT